MHKLCYSTVNAVKSHAGDLDLFPPKPDTVTGGVTIGTWLKQWKRSDSTGRHV